MALFWSFVAAMWTVGGAVLGILIIKDRRSKRRRERGKVN